MCELIAGIIHEKMAYVVGDGRFVAKDAGGIDVVDGRNVFVKDIEK